MRCRILYCLSLLFCVGGLPRAVALEPNEAERVLANIPLGPPMSVSQWEQKLAGRVGSQYLIRSGDTLWGISNRLFQTPRLWPKLWAENRHLSNPHELEPGQQLDFSTIQIPENISREPQSIASLTKVVKLRPKGASLDVDSEGPMSLSPVSISNRFRPSLVVFEADRSMGEISGAYERRELFFEGDQLFVRLDDMENARVGDRFSVIEPVENVPFGVSDAGQLMRLVGEIEMEGFGENIARAKVVRASGPLKRGQRLIAPVEVVSLSYFSDPPEDLEATIILGEVPEATLFGQGQLVLLDKGRVDAVEVGQLFRVFRDADPVTESESDVGKGYKGEVQIVFAGERASVGYLLRNEEPLRLGDKLLANQLFLDPVAPPKRSLTVLEID